MVLPGDVPLHVMKKLRTASRIKVYRILYAHRDRRRECWPSQERIAELIDTTRSVVSRAIGQLVKMGAIEREPRYDERGGQTTNLYRICRDFLTGGDSVCVTKRRGVSESVTNTENPAARPHEGKVQLSLKIPDPLPSEPCTIAPVSEDGCAPPPMSHVVCHKPHDPDRALQGCVQRTRQFILDTVAEGRDAVLRQFEAAAAQREAEPKVRGPVRRFFDYWVERCKNSDWNRRRQYDIARRHTGGVVIGPEPPPPSPPPAETPKRLVGFNPNFKFPFNSDPAELMKHLPA